MNQEELEMVKQEAARVNVDILGTSELKWRDRENLIQMTTMSTQKNDSSLFLRQTIQYHSNPTLCSNH